MTLKITTFPCLTDNYGFIVTDEASGRTACIDTPDATAIAHKLAQLGHHRLDYILNTHWHPDHAGGNAALKLQYGAAIYGPPEITKTGPLDHVVTPGEVFMLGETRLDVLDLGGHTLGLIGWHDAIGHNAFIGDCLFPLGCGRMFEGTPEQFWTSLERLCALPDDTVLYSAHEYSLASLIFAESLGVDNALAARAARIRAMRERGDYTVPSTLGEEKTTNPFLVYPLREATFAARAAKFGELRALKDNFR